MRMLQDILDASVRKQFSVENMGIRVIERRLEELGIKLTATQRNELRKTLEERGFDSISFSIEDDQIPTELLAMNPPKRGRLTLDLGDSELLIKDIAGQFFDQLTEAIPEMARDIGAIITSQLRKRAKRMLRTKRKDTKHYESEITTCWGAAFDLLEPMIVVAFEAGQDFNNEFRNALPSGKENLIEATTRLHAK